MNGRQPAFAWIRLSLAALLLACASSQGLAVDLPVGEEMGAVGEAPGAFENPLFVEPRGVQAQRAKFVQELRPMGRDKRALVEKYLPVIGSNGIVDGIKAVWPKCHSEAHDLGKVIFARVRDIGKGLRICADECNSGCMHGILMEAFTSIGRAAPHHMDLAVLKPAIKDLCQRNPVMTASYSPGDCAHGVGHALMYMAGYDISQAVTACAGNEDRAMEYYCATGAYMEYVTERDPQDAVAKSVLYPCDTSIYPAACARYKMVHVVRRHYEAGKTTEALRQQCAALSGAVRLGCFHGLGNAHMPLIAAHKIGIRRVCLNLGAVEEFVCIDGAMERMAKFHEPRAREVCEELDGSNKSACLTAVSNKMYNMKKDLSLYLGK